MKYILELKDSGGGLTYTISKPYFVSMLQKKYEWNII